MDLPGPAAIQSMFPRLEIDESSVLPEFLIDDQDPPEIVFVGDSNEPGSDYRHRLVVLSYDSGCWLEVFRTEVSALHAYHVNPAIKGLRDGERTLWVTCWVGGTGSYLSTAVFTGFQSVREQEPAVLFDTPCLANERGVIGGGELFLVDGHIVVKRPGTLTRHTLDSVSRQWTATPLTEAPHPEPRDGDVLVGYYHSNRLGEEVAIDVRVGSRIILFRDDLELEPGLDIEADITLSSPDSIDWDDESGRWPCALVRARKAGTATITIGSENWSDDAKLKVAVRVVDSKQRPHLNRSSGR